MESSSLAVEVLASNFETAINWVGLLTMSHMIGKSHPLDINTREDIAQCEKNSDDDASTRNTSSLTVDSIEAF
jgi:hypothetical protein